MITLGREGNRFEERLRMILADCNFQSFLFLLYSASVTTIAVFSE